MSHLFKGTLFLNSCYKVCSNVRKRSVLNKYFLSVCIIRCSVSAFGQEFAFRCIPKTSYDVTITCIFLHREGHCGAMTQAHGTHQDMREMKQPKNCWARAWARQLRVWGVWSMIMPLWSMLVLLAQRDETHESDMGHRTKGAQHRQEGSMDIMIGGR